MIDPTTIEGLRKHLLESVAEAGRRLEVERQADPQALPAIHFAVALFTAALQHTRMCPRCRSRAVLGVEMCQPCARLQQVFLVAPSERAP